MVKLLRKVRICINRRYKTHSDEKCYGVFMLLWKFSYDGGHIVRKLCLKCISVYIFIQIVVNKGQTKKCGLKMSVFVM